MDSISASLIEAQRKAEALFAAVVSNGIIQAGKLESLLDTEIYQLAKSHFGVRRHWHKRIVRSGPNTLLTYFDESVDRELMDDDIVFLDFGPVFDEWESDLGRTYALGVDPVKHRLIADLEIAFTQGKQLFQRTPDLTAGELYDYVASLAIKAGWEFGASTAGHLIGHFPHEHGPRDADRFWIQHGNDICLRELDANGQSRHWILEIHLVDRSREIGGFFEQLLTA